MKIHMLMDGVYDPRENPVVCSWNERNAMKSTRDSKKVTCLRCLAGMEGSYRAFGKYAELFEEK